MDVCTLARQGEPLALQEVAREGRYLGIGVANLVTLFAPELIVLGGSVMGSADLFLPAIRERVRSNCGLIPSECVQVASASLGSDAPLIGAALVWHQRIESGGQRC
jgi:glucokinase